MNAIISHLKTSIPLVCVVIILFTSSCSDDGNPVLDSFDRDKVELGITKDTLYSTPFDSVQVGMYFRTDPWQYDEMQIYLDYGDGSKPRYLGQGDVKSYYIMGYQQEGTYRVVLWGELYGMPVIADTSYMIVQQYVRPRLAKKLLISVEGVVAHLYNRKKEAATGLDTAYLTKAYGLESVKTTYPMALSHMGMGWRYTQRVSIMHIFGNPSLERWGVGNIDIYLSDDGNLIESMSISTSENADSLGLMFDQSTEIHLANIPLKPGSTPERGSAIYEFKGSPNVPGGLVSVIRSGSLTDGSYTHSWETVDLDRQPEVHIRVEFSQ